MKKNIFIFVIFISLIFKIQAQETERGLAELIPSEETSENLLALHRTFPNGTFITVKNTTNGRKIRAKVIGKIPDIAINEKVVVKISQFAYDGLLGKGKKFPVEVSIAPKTDEEKEDEREKEKEKITEKNPKEEPNKTLKTHIVKKGETLFSISKKYKTTPQNIEKWNNLEKSIKVGQELAVEAPKKEKESPKK
ncbi:MAG: LysM domain-containing protein [Bacteroidetes bacterium]|nr:MAG: LysM domain-containing protein [Bacteroidota bacterium]TAG89979.1 MAG: LysM domain-containing protein [Bacteroidota bacterium]